MTEQLHFTSLLLLNNIYSVLPEPSYDASEPADGDCSHEIKRRLQTSTATMENGVEIP